MCFCKLRADAVSAQRPALAGSPKCLAGVGLAELQIWCHLTSHEGARAQNDTAGEQVLRLVDHILPLTITRETLDHEHTTLMSEFNPKLAAPSDDSMTSAHHRNSSVRPILPSVTFLAA